jgi:HSP20 family protein
MLEIDETIGRVENLYRALTGKPCEDSAAPYAPIPEGVDPDAHVQKELDRLLAVLGAAGPTFERHAWTPPISVVEAAVEILFYLDVPGVSRERLTVSLDGGVLVVEGRRALEHANGDRPPRVFGDRQTGPFRRSVALPPGLDLEKMGARLVDGVLEIRIPRIANGESKAIPIA